MDLTASSAVNLPISSASLRLNVIWTGVRSIRCTYSAAWVPPRSTFTINLEEQQIQQRAYELYEQRGRTDGHDLGDWLQTECEIKGTQANAATA
jgi:hypothetical protein